MFVLTLPLQPSADVLGTEPDILQKFLQAENIAGVIKLEKGWRISIFTLAQLLNTTPETFLDLLEDEALGELLEQVEDDETFSREDALQIYRTYQTKT